MEPSGDLIVQRKVPPDWLMAVSNPVVKAVLRSPFHGLMDRNLVLLSVTGTKTGRVYTIPVALTHVDGIPTIVTDHTWWRNLRGGAEVGVRMRGQDLVASTLVIEDPRSVLTLTRKLVAEVGGWKRARMFGLAWTGEAEPTDDQLASALTRRTMVQLTNLRPAPGGKA